MSKRGITPEQAKKIREAKGLKDTKLQEMRLKKGYSQNDLAIASGINVRTIQHYESEIRDINGAKLETLCDLAIALDCKITDIVSNEQLIKKYKMIEKRNSTN